MRLLLPAKGQSLPSTLLLIGVRLRQRPTRPVGAVADIAASGLAHRSLRDNPEQIGTQKERLARFVAVSTFSWSTNHSSIIRPSDIVIALMVCRSLARHCLRPVSCGLECNRSLRHHHHFHSAVSCSGPPPLGRRENAPVVVLDSLPETSSIFL